MSGGLGICTVEKSSDDGIFFSFSSPFSDNAESGDCLIDRTSLTVLGFNKSELNEVSVNGVSETRLTVFQSRPPVSWVGIRVLILADVFPPSFLQPGCMDSKTKKKSHH